MDLDDLQKYETRVPRYTSYPTAAQFHDGVDARVYAHALGALDLGRPISVYLHVPFCSRLCWYCACNTQVMRAPAVLAAYAERLCREIDLVADHLSGRAAVSHVHWGGGTPTMLDADGLARVGDHVATRFEVLSDAEIAIEVDPCDVETLDWNGIGALGLTRASIGVQDFDPRVQRAINRMQGFSETRDVVERLRAIGVGDLNVDLVYGLPHQNADSFLTTIEQTVTLAPDRLALFGYAHVPWMKAHQRLIDEAALPGPAERLALFAAGTRRLNAMGYQTIGLDHFARAGSDLAGAARDGRMRRNFQGYTADRAETLLGFGASAISFLPGAMVQNASAPRAYQEAIDGAKLATRRGVRRTDEDRLRGEIIERLMCDFSVDIDDIANRHASDVEQFADDLAAMEPFVRDGLVELEGRTVAMTARGRPFVRVAAAVFDRYYSSARRAHSSAI